MAVGDYTRIGKVESRVRLRGFLSTDHRLYFSSATNKMADDTRQPSEQPINRETLNVDPQNKAFTGSQWDDKESKTFKPPENANMMAGGTEHTAGGKVPEVTIWNALQYGQPVTEIHKRPCVRDALMVGMGAGAATGAIRIIWRGMG